MMKTALWSVVSSESSASYPRRSGSDGFKREHIASSGTFSTRTRPASPACTDEDESFRESAVSILSGESISSPYETGRGQCSRNV